MAPSNLAVLTQSHNAIAAKKRAKRDQIKEIIFDDEARREFLTGFHKRKLAKAEAAKRKAVEREKQERLEARRDQRRMLRERAIENAAQVEKAYGAILGDNVDEEDEEWTGISDSPENGKGVQKEEEYEDEEMLATVTVVEDFDPDSFIHGPRIKTDPALSSSSTNHPSTAVKPKRDKSRNEAKAKKARYETKDARKVERTEQRTRRMEKAELARGKAARRKGPQAGGGKKKARATR